MATETTETSEAAKPSEMAAAWEEIIRFQEENPTVWGDQDENGVDVARLRENLALSPAERLQKHDYVVYGFSKPNPQTIPVCRAFHDAGIDVVLAGAKAMVAHGANTATLNTDFAYAVEAANLERLAAFLNSLPARVLGRPAGVPFVFTPELLTRVRFLNLATPLGPIDVMREIPGVESWDGLRARAVPVDMGGFVVPVASLSDLIAMKRAANRPKDQTHLYELLALQKLTQPAPSDTP